MTIFSWLNFGRPAPPGSGSVAGRKFLAPPYYSQCAVYASLWVLFSFYLGRISDSSELMVFRIHKTSVYIYIYVCVQLCWLSWAAIIAGQIRVYQHVLARAVCSPRLCHRLWGLNTNLHPRTFLYHLSLALCNCREAVFVKNDRYDVCKLSVCVWGAIVTSNKEGLIFTRNVFVCLFVCLFVS